MRKLIFIVFVILFLFVGKKASSQPYHTGYMGKFNSLSIKGFRTTNTSDIYSKKRSYGYLVNYERAIGRQVSLNLEFSHNTANMTRLSSSITVKDLANSSKFYLSMESGNLEVTQRMYKIGIGIYPYFKGGMAPFGPYTKLNLSLLEFKYSDNNVIYKEQRGYQLYTIHNQDKYRPLYYLGGVVNLGQKVRLTNQFYLDYGVDLSLYVMPIHKEKRIGTTSGSAPEFNNIEAIEETFSSTKTIEKLLIYRLGVGILF